MFNKKLEKKIKKLEKQVTALEARLEEYKEASSHSCSSVRSDIPNVREEGEKWFADKRVQMIVYGFVAMILTAAGTSFLGGVPWL